MSATPHTTRRRRRVPKKLAAITMAGVVIGNTAADAAPQRPTLDPAQVCNLHTVVSGDTMSRVAKRAGITLEDFIARNRHVINPDRLWPNDVLVINCEARTVAIPAPAPTSTSPTRPSAPPAPAPTAPPAEVQRIVKQPWADLGEWPNSMGCTRAEYDESDKGKERCLTQVWLDGEQVHNGVASQALILRTLFNEGARGNKLIGLAAVTQGESNRRLNSEGDQHLADKTWDASISPWQIRSENKQRGKGTARDIEALRARPLEHGAAAASEIYYAALAAGRDPLSPWTAHLLKNDRAFLEPYRLLAQRLGMLDGQ